MRQIITICIVGLLSFRLYAAGPAMHVVLGEEWLTRFAPQYQEEEKKLFLLGTVFPDIRYLGVIKRSESHFKNVTLAKVYKTSNPFQRGMLFHSFVDEYRDKLVRKSSIENKLSEIPARFRSTFLKLVEDQILGGDHDWSHFRHCLTSIPEEEKAFGIDTQALTQWHTGLGLYFSAAPSFLLAQISLFDIGILSVDAVTIKQWSTLIPKYATDPVMQEYVKNILTAFHQTFEQNARQI